MKRERKTIITKGTMIFSLEAEENSYSINMEVYEDEYSKREIEEIDFIEGKDFLESVRSYGFIDYDGWISEIIVDGYLSNLGLREARLSSGKFLVGGNLFEEICEQHEVIVNWVNK